jgi:hypothetical protein
MTNAADASSTPAASELHRLSPRDESRVALALTLRQLADAVLDAVPVEPDPAPGDLLRAALRLQRRVEDVVREAVVAERERGTSWHEIGEAAGVTRQSAHEKWYSDVHAWAAIGRSALPPHLKTLEVAAEADARYARLRPDRPHAVTSGLDAVRFPALTRTRPACVPAARLCTPAARTWTRRPRGSTRSTAHCTPGAPRPRPSAATPW